MKKGSINQNDTNAGIELLVKTAPLEELRLFAVTGLADRIFNNSYGSLPRIPIDDTEEARKIILKYKEYKEAYNDYLYNTNIIVGQR
ncbi:MAG TPA: hypothetical protein HA226_03140 [Nanoarchaeota archaeon]|nr:MAG: hypothetical protein QT09_C0014G0056 [archaeon GW2011_AR18]HIH25741.1 hypothetical protein [Nanoarchaeota archaeon]